MKDYEIFNNEEAFKKWLPLNGVKSTYYSHNIKQVQKYLKISIDVLLKSGIDEAVLKIKNANIEQSEGFSKGFVKNFITAIKKYDKFRQTMNNNCLR